MTSKIKIVTDSTSDLPQEFVEKYDIHVVPLYVNFPDKTYRDRVDIAPTQFFSLLKKNKDILPKTSTPSIADFAKVYELLLKKGYDIISIHLSSGLSSTVSQAQAAANLLNGNIRVFDSKSISLGIGLQVVETVEMIKNNFSLDKITNRLTDIRLRTEVMFSVDTLEYLQKGGRIGKVSALIGSVLKIKPVVRVENGIYVPLDKVRNQKQAVQRMVEHTCKMLGGLAPKHIVVAHGAAEDIAAALKIALEEKFNMKLTFFTEVGPVIGVHTGPGVLGMAFYY